MAVFSFKKNDDEVRLAQFAAHQDAAVVVDANPARKRLAQARRVLLLQGPLGPFFDRLTVWLQEGGAQVHLVAFQGGDVYDSRRIKPIIYSRKLEEWPAFVTDLYNNLDIDCVVLFGQSRKYHAAARALAIQRNLSVVVLEEGYFRPGFVTMELGGVNGYSTTMKNFVWKPSTTGADGIPRIAAAASIQPDISPWHFQKMAWHASWHYKAMHDARFEFANYVHHRNDDPKQYARYWLRSWRRKVVSHARDHRFQTHLFKDSTPYFLVPLQHDGDAQITHHSPFTQNTEFIIRVMRSFAEHAPPDTLLVFRQHPHSRGGPGHMGLIFGLAVELGIRTRVHHMVEGDTPDIAENSAGVVLINSTVGLQALERGAPLMALGEALYRQPGLTFSGDLDDFWQHARPADKEVTSAFLLQIKNLTQASASVYGLFNEPLRWKRS